MKLAMHNKRFKLTGGKKRRRLSGRYMYPKIILICFLIILTSCVANPKDFAGVIEYSKSPNLCKLVSKEHFSHIMIESYTQLSENYFKRIAIKKKANYISLTEPELVHVNSREIESRGYHFSTQAELYSCKNI